MQLPSVLLYESRYNMDLNIKIKPPAISHQDIHKSDAHLNAAVPVFSINFIRKESLALRVRHALIYGALVISTVQIVIFLVLVVMASMIHGAVKNERARPQLQNLSSNSIPVIYDEISSLDRKAGRTLAQLNTRIEQEALRFPIGGKLAALSKTIPPRTWITKIKGDHSRRSMKIYANYVLDSENPQILPVKDWIDALHEDSAFSSELKQLEMVSSSRSQQGKAKLFSFEIQAEWK